MSIGPGSRSILIAALPVVLVASCAGPARTAQPLPGLGALRPDDAAPFRSSDLAAPRARLADADPAALAPDVVKSVIVEHFAEVRLCYEQHMRPCPNLSERITVHFVIEPDGHVTGAAATEPASLGSDFDACVIASVRRLRFPAIRGDKPVTVTYPFVLSPE